MAVMISSEQCWCTATPVLITQVVTEAILGPDALPSQQPTHAALNGCFKGTIAGQAPASLPLSLRPSLSLPLSCSTTSHASLPTLTPAAHHPGTPPAPASLTPTMSPAYLHSPSCLPAHLNLQHTAQALLQPSLKPSHLLITKHRSHCCCCCFCATTNTLTSQPLAPGAP